MFCSPHSFGNPGGAWRCRTPQTAVGNFWYDFQKYLINYKKWWIGHTFFRHGLGNSGSGEIVPTNYYLWVCVKN
jgi:hypothetical protein